MLTRKFFKFCISALATLVFSANVLGAEHGTAAEAMALVKKAIAFEKAEGKENLLKEASNHAGKFIDRDLYLSVYSFDGVVLAHGVNPKIIGKNIVNLNDIDGKLFIKDILQQAKANGKGTEDYKWPHPVTKEYQEKSAYFEVVDGLIISCGYYKY